MSDIPFGKVPDPIEKPEKPWVCFLCGAWVAAGATHKCADCPECQGSGSVRKRPGREVVPCQNCEGTGRIVIE